MEAGGGGEAEWPVYYKNTEVLVSWAVVLWSRAHGGFSLPGPGRWAFPHVSWWQEAARARAGGAALGLACHVSSLASVTKANSMTLVSPPLFRGPPSELETVHEWKLIAVS